MITINKNYRIKRFFRVITFVLVVFIITGNSALLRSVPLNQKRITVRKKLATRDLHHAAATGNTTLISHAIKNGALINARDALGDTPLIKAAFKGNVEAVKQLLGLNANPNTSSTGTFAGLTPLLAACTCGVEEIKMIVMVSALLKKGAKKDVFLTFGKHKITPLSCAQEYHYPSLIRLLSGK